MLDYIVANWTSFIGPAVVAAIISGIVAVTGFVITSRNARAIHREKLAADRELSERKINADVTLANKKFDFDSQLAERRIQLDIQLAARKRQTDLAEQVLADFYRVRDVLTWVRNPASSGEEGSSRPRLAGEIPARSGYLDALYVPIARLGRESELFARILANKPRFEANFGPDSGQAFSEIRGVYNRIIAASNGLINTECSVAYENRPEQFIDILQRMRAIIWEGLEEPDTIATTIARAVTAIEALCVPILRDQNHGANGSDFSQLPLTATKI